MKVILREPKTGKETEIKNAEIFGSTMVKRRPCKDGLYIKSYPIGDPMIIITSNVPQELRTQIERMVVSYCNY
jgi:hypothetical protein